eukprot:TRINITY_DN3326_c0_g1_i3.p1 TRINITY_DN3326_c0_g1~~TRINITY_DN3326_c0_g1_i3.p1  ORF type:complete len:998 (-),score=174.82 TRINITY_DN3326_c0_g1_i3:605-3598(-)
MGYNLRKSEGVQNQTRQLGGEIAPSQQHGFDRGGIDVNKKTQPQPQGQSVGGGGGTWYQQYYDYGEVRGGGAVGGRGVSFAGRVEVEGASSGVNSQSQQLGSTIGQSEQVGYNLSVGGGSSSVNSQAQQFGGPVAQAQQVGHTLSGSGVANNETQSEQKGFNRGGTGFGGGVDNKRQSQAWHIGGGGGGKGELQYYEYSEAGPSVKNQPQLLPSAVGQTQQQDSDVGGSAGVRGQSQQIGGAVGQTQQQSCNCSATSGFRGQTEQLGRSVGKLEQPDCDCSGNRTIGAQMSEHSQAPGGGGGGGYDGVRGANSGAQSSFGSDGGVKGEGGGVEERGGGSTAAKSQTQQLGSDSGGKGGGEGGRASIAVNGQFQQPASAIGRTQQLGSDDNGKAGEGRGDGNVSGKSQPYQLAGAVTQSLQLGLDASGKGGGVGGYAGEADGGGGSSAVKNLIKQIGSVIGQMQQAGPDDTWKVGGEGRSNVKSQAQQLGSVIGQTQKHVSDDTMQSGGRGGIGGREGGISGVKSQSRQLGQQQGQDGSIQGSQKQFTDVIDPTEQLGGVIVQSQKQGCDCDGSGSANGQIKQYNSVSGQPNELDCGCSGVASVRSKTEQVGGSTSISVGGIGDVKSQIPLRGGVISKEQQTQCDCGESSATPSQQISCDCAGKEGVKGPIQQVSISKQPDGDGGGIINTQKVIPLRAIVVPKIEKGNSDCGGSGDFKGQTQQTQHLDVDSGSVGSVQGQSKQLGGVVGKSKGQKKGSWKDGGKGRTVLRGSKTQTQHDGFVQDQAPLPCHDLGNGGVVESKTTQHAVVKEAHQPCGEDQQPSYDYDEVVAEHPKMLDGTAFKHKQQSVVACKDQQPCAKVGYDYPTEHSDAKTSKTQQSGTDVFEIGGEPKQPCVTDITTPQPLTEGKAGKQHRKAKRMQQLGVVIGKTELPRFDHPVTNGVDRQSTAKAVEKPCDVASKLTTEQPCDTDTMTAQPCTQSLAKQMYVASRQQSVPAT